MADLDQERTEQPTPKRLEEARKRGQVPRSTDLNAAAVVMVASAGLNGRMTAKSLSPEGRSCTRGE